MEQVLTNEQRQVIVDLESGHHVVVRAGPGMGKSTLALHVAAKFRSQRILLVVYNRRLKDDTRQRASLQGLSNIEVHTYHSLTRRYFYDRCHDNIGIQHALQRSAPPIHAIDFDVLILDEQQDMTRLYARLVSHVVKHNERALQTLVLGDERQSIYDFNHADARFLTRASTVFAPINHARSWVERRLTITHRLTTQMANTVNKVFLGGERRFRSMRQGNPVRFWVGDVFDAFNLAREVERWISAGAAYQDIMVIAPSVRTSSANSPIARLENRLVQLGYPVTVTTSDDGPIMAEVVSGKILFASFHQTKGTERKHVLVMGVDSGYFKYINPSADRMVCPNPVFVAVTRAQEELTIAINKTNGLMPFVNEDVFMNDCGDDWMVINTTMKPLCAADMLALAMNRRWSVTDLVRHQSDEVMEKVMSMVRWTCLSPAVNDHDIPHTVVCKNGLKEQVSDLTGLAVPALHELRTRGRCCIMDTILTLRECTADDVHTQIIDDAYQSEGQVTSLKDMLYISVVYHTKVTGLMHRVQQLDTFDWISPQTEAIMLGNMKKIAHHNDMFTCEKKLVKTLQHGTVITGCADFINESDKVLFEIKTVSQLMPEHMLQLGLYALLLGRADYKHVLFNIVTGEQWKLVYDEATLLAIATLLVQEKSRHTPPATDDEFIEDTLKIWPKAFGV